MDKFPACFDQNIGMNFGKKYPYPIFFYTLHTRPLFISYSATSCEGTSFTPAGGAARYASTCRLVFESQKLTDIQEDGAFVKDRFY